MGCGSIGLLHICVIMDCRECTSVFSQPMYDMSEFGVVVLLCDSNWPTNPTVGGLTSSVFVIAATLDDSCRLH